MEIKTIPINKIKIHPKNYKQHPKEQIEAIKKSIQEFGIYKNIVISKDFYILAGHGVFQAAKELGYEKIPVKQMNFTYDDVRSLSLMVADNELNNRAIVDDTRLLELLKEIQEVNLDLIELTGFDEKQIKALETLTAEQFKEIRENGIIGKIENTLEYVEEIPEFKLIIIFKSEKQRNEFIEKYLSDFKEKILIQEKHNFKTFSLNLIEK